MTTNEVVVCIIRRCGDVVLRTDNAKATAPLNPKKAM